MNLHGIFLIKKFKNGVLGEWIFNFETLVKKENKNSASRRVVEVDSKYQMKLFGFWDSYVMKQTEILVC